MAHERDRFGAEIVWKRVEVSEIPWNWTGRENLWSSGRICAGKGDLSNNNKAMLGTDPFIVHAFMLDNRILTKRYGQAFLDSAPKCPMEVV
jgi:hypothetical protein